jgi:exopolysaccharide biosynthesis polyprenyl glycosylphosphotransferase
MKKILSFLFDYLLVAVSVFGGYVLSPKFEGRAFQGWVPHPEIWGPLAVIALFMTLGLRVASLGWGRRRRSLMEIEIHTLAGLGFGLVVYQLVHAILTTKLMDRYVHFIALVLANFLVFFSRYVYRIVSGRYARTVIVFGSPGSYEHFKVSLEHVLQGAYRAIGYLEQGAGSPATREDPSRLEPGKLSLYEYCVRHSVDDVLVEVGGRISPEDSDALMFCTAQGINVMEITTFYEKYFERVHEASLDERWFWGYDSARHHTYYSMFKRSFDIAVSILGMLLLLPVVPIIFLLIKLQDGGPVLYSQIRTGLYNRPFRIYKFRTMRIDAESNGAQWASKNDGRVTWLGNLLRKTRLDEVPQFWNILIGDMSFIGPRPERPEMIEQIEKEVPFFRYRHLIKPGLTGWAQINYPYGASVEDARNKLSFDFYYMKYASAVLDLMIVFRTLIAAAKGAR